MLTRSTAFARFADRRGTQIDSIVCITDGSDQYYFSHRPMPKGLNTAPVYPVLMSHSGISEGVDIFSKRFRISDVVITINDEPFYPYTGGTPIRASQLLSGVNGSDIDIYLMVGETIEDISDCLHVFSGLVLTSLTVINNTISFSAKDGSKLNDLILPQRLLEDAFTSVPTDLRGRRIPLVYGEFDAGSDSDDLFDYTGTGLARAIAYQDQLYSRNAVADHDIHSMRFNNEFCVNFGGPTPVPAAYHTGGVDNGVYYRQLISGQYGLYLWFWLSSTLDAVYDDESFLAINPENAHDGTIATKADIYDNDYDNGTDMKGLALWYILRNSMFSKHIQSGGELLGVYGGLAMGDVVMSSIYRITLYLYFGREDAVDERIEFGRVQRPNIDWGAGWGSEFDDQDITSGSFSTDLYGTVYALGCEVWVYNEPGTADSVVGNQSMLKIGELRIKMNFVISTRPNEVWIGCRGRYFGSWIDDVSRTNVFDAGDYIDSPSYIIESLYRDEVGLTDDEIDMDSFDNAYNSSVESRLNVITETSLSEIVRKLSEQSTFVICYTGVGKLRAIPLDDTSPTILATIERSHVIGDDIRIKKTDHIVNQAVIESRWQGENAAYIDIDLYEDAVSQGAYRTRSGSYRWPNICGTSAIHVAQHYINTTNGLWSKEHIVIEFKTDGFRYAHLQAGDWVQLTTDFDGIRKPFGGTWQYKNLLVVGVKKTSTYVELELLEVDETTATAPSPTPSVSPSPSPSPTSPVPVGLWEPWDSTPTSGALNEEVDLVDDVLDVWCCKSIGKECSVGIYMDGIATLSALRVYDDGIWGAGTSGVRGLKLYTSMDGTTWTYIETQDPVTRVATGGVNDPYYIQFTFTGNQTARYFKLHAFDGPILSATGYEILLTEIVETTV